MDRLPAIVLFFFFLGWFFFPFNDFEGIKELGEFKSESGAYFFFAGFLCLLVFWLRSGRAFIPFKSHIFRVIVFFLIWCILTVLFNFSAVSGSYFKHTSGFTRFARQYFSLLLSVIVFFLLFWNVVRQMPVSTILRKIRKVMLFSLCFVFVYGFIETLIVVFHMGFLRPILAVFDYFPFLDVNYQPGDRISSVTWESPSLGNYLITVAGWMFSYLFTERSKWRFFPTLMILFLTFFSGSRTAFINIALQLVVLAVALYQTKQYRYLLVKMLQYSFILLAMVFIANGPRIYDAFEEKIETLNFKQNLKKNVSNQSRFGMQYASLQVFKDHPIVGVGFGQETYYKRHYYPRWAKKDNYEFKLFYENKNYRSFPTAYNLYTRLLAETGIIGTGLFIYLIFLCVLGAYRSYRQTDADVKVMSLVLLISFVGLSMNWFQTDFFRQYGFWLCAAILIKIFQDRRQSENLS